MLKVSFVIPTYNRLNYLKETIESIEKQTDNQYEIIVSENNCTDGTKEWLRGKKGIKVIYHEENIPVLENWNDGVKLAKGNFIIVLGDDDLVYSDMVKDIDVISKEYNNLSMIVFNHNIIDENGKLVSKYVMKQKGLYNKPKAFEFFKYGVSNRMCAIAIDREALADCNYFNDNFKITASDSELVQKLSLAGNVYFENSEKKACSYRVWNGSETYKRLLSEQWHSEIKLWCNNIRGFLKDNNEYDVDDITERIVFENYYAAIANNIDVKHKDRLRQIVKEMPKAHSNIKLSIYKMIVSSDHLLKIFGIVKRKWVKR